MCTRILQETRIDLLGRIYHVETEYHFPPPGLPDVPQPGLLTEGAKVLVCARGTEGPKLGTMEWGFVPAGARDRSFAPLNARSETVGSKTLFREAFERRRCIMPVSAWYEFGPRGAGRRSVWRIQRTDGEPTHLAGIWNHWRGTDPTPTLAILTTRPLPRLRQIHDRQPAILNSEDEQAAWLNADTPVDTLRTLAQRAGADVYSIQRVDGLPARRAGG